MGWVKQKLLEDEQYQQERRMNMDSFDLDPQCEEISEDREMYLEPEIVVVDATTSGNREFRLTKVDGMFVVEEFDPLRLNWTKVSELTPYELMQKVVEVNQ